MKQSAVLIGAFAVLAGGTMLALAGRRRTATPPPDIIEGTLGKVEPIQKIGEICVFEDGRISAIDSNYECVEFWNDDAEAVLIEALQDEFSAQGSSVNACTPIPVFDHGTGGTAYEMSSAGRNIVNTVLRELYPGITWPPRQNAQPWQKYIYQLATSRYEEHVCGLPVPT